MNAVALPRREWILVVQPLVIIGSGITASHVHNITITNELLTQVPSISKYISLSWDVTIIIYVFPLTSPFLLIQFFRCLIHFLQHHSSRSSLSILSSYCSNNFFCYFPLVFVTNAMSFSMLFQFHPVMDDTITNTMHFCLQIISCLAFLFTREKMRISYSKREDSVISALSVNTLHRQFLSCQ